MKISSRMRRLVRDYREAEEAKDLSKVAELLDSLRDFPMFVAAMLQATDPTWLELLPALANLRADANLAGLRKRFPKLLDSESDEALFALRDELQSIWGETGISVHPVLEKWFGGAESIPNPKQWTVFWEFGMIWPKFFRGHLALAFSRLRSRLAMCQNPECEAPYFVAAKRTQKYCSQTDACARYAAREAARKYWRDKVGKQRRKGH